MAQSGWDLAVDGMERSYDAATDEWKTVATKAVETTCLQLQELTVDDVWERFPAGFKLTSGSALGQIMRDAKKSNWIVNTGKYRNGTRAAMHCRPVPIWKSLLYIKEPQRWLWDDAEAS